MKSILTLIALFIAITTQAQIETVPNQFWNNFSHYNPAYAGLQYQRQAGLMYQGFRKFNYQHDYQGFYNQRLKKSFGIGFNGNHMSAMDDQTSEVSIPISYDWNVAGKHHIAIGVAPSYRNHVASAMITADSSGNIHVPTRNHFQTHAGIVYKRGNFYAGFGIRNINLRSWGDSEAGSWNPHYYSHVSAAIPIGSRSEYNNRHKLILSGMYTYVNGFSRVDLNARVQWENGLNVFVGGRVRGGWTVGGGWDLFQKLRCLYSVSWQRSKLNNANSLSHELSVIYQLPFSD